MGTEDKIYSKNGNETEELMVIGVIRILRHKNQIAFRKATTIRAHGFKSWLPYILVLCIRSATGNRKPKGTPS
jgi:hypothetical protein